MSDVFEVKLLQSKTGKKPVAEFRVSDQQCYTFSHAAYGKTDKKFSYYTCIQCKAVDRKTKVANRFML
jgi:hypothetical protein